ncbi:ATP-binding protein [Microvirga thermotolerans]|uniref:histidine kinase n=1 Tax=Microvirga thermotolerans TaxID=2651334 RepID=A0A5P9JR56_9HYPH|nr:ATP-binding protein [Microvirga thermotolerans]QFU15127.1 GAF domain-containing protein [Microvirga thermotolerans]
MNVRTTGQGIDLTACDREPIHIPGSIQPYGLLLAMSPEERILTYVSANAAPAFGLDRGALLGRPIREALPRLEALLGPDLGRADAPSGPGFARTVSLDTAAGPRRFDAVVHRSERATILELEECVPGEEATLDTLYPGMRRFVERLQAAATTDDLCRLVAQDVRAITGFDRVLVYRFDAQWNGNVVAEDRNDALPSYLGLRFPASDIPAQARELYRRNRLRIVPDANYVPVPIEALGPEPLDLSDAVLRSVSPVHLEYMRNMGTMASMSVSILRDGVLWGLISCHNKEPRRVPLQVRNACDFLAQIFSMQLDARERAARAEDRMRLGSVQARLLGYMAAEDVFIDGLVKHPGELMELAGAQGAAIVSDDYCLRFGRTPDEAQVKDLFAWLSRHHREDVFVTDALPAHHPAAAAYAARASGLVAIAISKVHRSYVLWFRPEAVQTVEWGGDPRKPARREAGAERLHPRNSFEVWKETVRGRSEPWSPGEIDAVKELRNAIVGIVLRRAEELASLADELRRSNRELEAFSYSVSHDLRAPFRHIVGYAELLKKQEMERLSERGRRYVDVIIESAYTAGTLVDNLLNFSHMGRTALKPRRVETRTLVDEVRQRLALDTADRRIVWTIGDLPPVHADPVMLRLVFENLLSNAVKYTRPREEAVIEIGSYREDGSTVFFVRDNGVGFDMAYVGKLFGVFQRLHRMEDFEGTGIGLANVRRIVERHGGRTWAEGAVDRGATFFFALPDSEGAS